jgi:hypothetical protein
MHGGELIRLQWTFFFSSLFSLFFHCQNIKVSFNLFLVSNSILILLIVIFLSFFFNFAHHYLVSFIFYIKSAHYFLIVFLILFNWISFLISSISIWFQIIFLIKFSSHSFNCYFFCFGYFYCFFFLFHPLAFWWFIILFYYFLEFAFYRVSSEFLRLTQVDFGFLGLFFKLIENWSSCFSFQSPLYRVIPIIYP